MISSLCLSMIEPRKRVSRLLRGKPVPTFPDHALAQSDTWRTGGFVGTCVRHFHGFRKARRNGVFFDNFVYHEFVISIAWKSALRWWSKQATEIMN